MKCSKIVLKLMAEHKNRGLSALERQNSPEGLAYMEYTTRRPAAALNVYVREKRSDMEPDIQRVIENTDFRVFINFDENYGAYVAHCLDTGAVATADTLEEAEELITSILKNDFRIAIEQKSLESLFRGRGQAPWEAAAGWHEVNASSPEQLKRITLEVSAGITKRPAQSEYGPKLFVVAKERSSAA